MRTPTGTDVVTALCGCLFVCLAGTAMIYAWLRGVHSPLKPSQKKILMFSFLFLAGAPVLSPAWAMSVGWWGVPETGATIAAGAAAILWFIACLRIVKSLGRPGRLLCDRGTVITDGR